MGSHEDREGMSDVSSVHSDSSGFHGFPAVERPIRVLSLFDGILSGRNKIWV